MNSSRFPRLALIATAAFAVCGLPHTVASETTISTSEIALPDIEGYSLLSHSSPTKHPVASMALSQCNPALCAVYFDTAEAAERSSESVESWPSFFMLEVLDDAFVIEPQEFKIVVQHLKENIEGLRSDMLQSVSAIAFPSISAPPGDKLEYLDSSLEFEDQYLEGDSYLIIPGHARNNYQRNDGTVVSYGFTATFGFLHAKDKMLLLSIIAPEKSLRWVSQTSQKIAEELKQSNL